MLNEFGGKAVSQLAAVERAEKAALKQQKQGLSAVEKAIAGQRISVDIEQGQTAPADTPDNPPPAQKPTGEKAAPPIPVNVQKTEKPADKKKTAESGSNALKAPLPDGWQRDDDGRIRDKTGRYVSDKELKKHGMTPPNDTKNDTEEEADNRRIFDSLEGIKEAVEQSENLDPIIDGFREISAPFGMVKEVAGRGLDKLFNSDKKEQRKTQRFRDRLLAFHKKAAKTDEKKQNAILGWLKALYKKPNGGSRFGWLGRLSGMLGLLLKTFGRLPMMLFGLLTGGVTRLFKGGLGLFGKGGKGLFSLLGGALGGLGKLGKGFLKKIPILGSLFSIGDGIVGLFDDSRDENGKSNRGKRVGGAIGTIAGGALGSLLGPAGTVIGALIGDFIGEKIGAWIADVDWSAMGKKIQDVWNGTLDWIKTGWSHINWGSIGEKIRGAWDGVLNWFTETWNSIDWGSIGGSVQKAWDTTTAWIKNTWDGLDFGTFGDKLHALWTPFAGFVADSWNKIDWGSFGEKIRGAWDGVLNWFTETWNGIDWGNAWEKTKDFVTDVKDKAVAAATQAKDKVTQWGNTAATYVSEKAQAAWNGVTSFAGDVKNKAGAFADAAKTKITDWGKSAVNFFTENRTTENNHTVTADNPATKSTIRVLENVDGSLSEQLSRQADTHAWLEKIYRVLADTLLLFRDTVSGGGATQTINGHPSEIAKFSDSGGVPLITGEAVDPKTGSKIKYTQGAFLGGNIDGLNAEQTALAMNALSARESSGNQHSVNQYGYMGLYQFGAEALADLGYIDKAKYQEAIKPYQRKNAKGKTYLDSSWWSGGHQAFLDNNANWHLAGGKQTYLNSKQLQDESAVRLMNKNIKWLKGQGVQLNSAEDIAGAGFAAHLKGAGNAKKLLAEGINTKDANGTGTAYYAQLGRNAVMGGKTVWLPPNQQAAVEAITLPSPQATMEGPVPSVAETAQGHIRIPEIAAPKLDFQAIGKKIEKETENNRPPNNGNSAPSPQIVNTSSGVDPIVGLLTQDVSDRRIAHIVTGGIAFRR